MIKFSKLNNKGFMLVEVVITSSVIAATLVGLFITLNKVSSSYEKRNRYYDLDAQQLAIEASRYIDIDNLNGKSNGFLYNLLKDNKNYVSFKRFASSEYNGNTNIYCCKYDSASLLSLKDFNKNNNLGTSASFSEYIDYLSNTINFDDKTYSYIIIVEIQKGSINDCYYYALKVE